MSGKTILRIVGLIVSVVMAFSMSGCSSPVGKLLSYLEKDSSEMTSDVSKDIIYEDGELAYVETESGNYYFGVTKATILPATSARGSVYQITWEYHNESFRTAENDVLGINPSDLSVVDSEGYLVEAMSSGWDGDWSNAYASIAEGQKCKAYCTFKINDPMCTYLEVTLLSRNITCRVEVSSAETTTDTKEQENGIYSQNDTADITGIWEAEFYYIDNEVKSTYGAEMTMYFFSDGTGMLTFDGDTTQYTWGYQGTDDNMNLYYIAFSGETKYFGYKIDPTDEFYHYIIFGLEDNIYIILDKQ